MKAIVELAPNITDTEQEKEAMMKDLRDFMLEAKADDDFLVFPPEDNDKEKPLEESSDVFDIDGKKKLFKYLSSVNNSNGFISFGQDELGLWWYFTRTGINSGKNLQGPFRSKEKLVSLIS